MLCSCSEVGAADFSVTSDVAMGKKDGDGRRTNANEYTIIAIPKSNFGIPRLVL